MSVEVRQISSPLVLGESPHWDERVEALYFVSIHERTIHKYDPITGDHTKTTLSPWGLSAKKFFNEIAKRLVDITGDRRAGDFLAQRISIAIQRGNVASILGTMPQGPLLDIDGRPGFIVPVEGPLDQFVVGLEREFVVVEWNGVEGSPAKVVKKLGEVDQHAPRNRINDGKADPRGRIFGGTMGYEESPGKFAEEQGSLYRVDGGGITRVCERIGISNGLAWDLRAKAMYYIDSLERNIRRYDYDIETGEISNMRHIFDLKKNGLVGFPDGGTIDTDGNLWVAVFGNACVLQVSPAGALLRRVPIPAKQVTSCTFGGPNLDILYVTTSRYMNKEGEGEPQDGCTFMVSGLGVKGHPNVNFKF